MMRYRVIFSDGQHTAWTEDMDRAYASATFFRAKVEVWDTVTNERYLTYWTGRPL
jgi:hypothetical protein